MAVKRCPDCKRPGYCKECDGHAMVKGKECTVCGGMGYCITCEGFGKVVDVEATAKEVKNGIKRRR